MKLVNHSCASESNTFEFSGVVQRNVQEHSRRLRPEIFSGRGPVWVSRSSSPPASPGRAGPGAPGTAPWVPPPPPTLEQTFSATGLTPDLTDEVGERLSQLLERKAFPLSF